MNLNARFIRECFIEFTKIVKDLYPGLTGECFEELINDTAIFKTQNYTIYLFDSTIVEGGKVYKTADLTTVEDCTDFLLSRYGKFQKGLLFDFYGTVIVI